uniref:RNA polymerase subunit beta'' n=1 Tax=Prototheca fontanea TaxID=2836215 RepID=UPI003002CA38
MKLHNMETINYNFNYYNKNKNQCFINGSFNKASLQKLIKHYLKKYGDKSTLDFLENLKKFGFSQATNAGISLGLDDLVIPEKKEDLIIEANLSTQKIDFEYLTGNLSIIEKTQRTISLWNNTSEILKDHVVLNFRKKAPLNSLSMMTFSGARGNLSQVRQLVGMRGLMADPQGIIVEVPIKTNFKEGITLTEYLISCFGARKGLVDTALRTATSGYLTRRLVDAVEYIIISIIDCQTDHGISIKNIYNKNSLIGRVLFNVSSNSTFDKKKINNHVPFFYNKEFLNFSKNTKSLMEKNQIISFSMANKLYNKYNDVYIRSPLTCRAFKSICQLCYGWDLAKGYLVDIGEAVGIIAAQSIGEPGTQLTMRTFHTGGVGVFSEALLKVYKAPFSGIINLPENLSGHMIRTQHGEIGYILKYSSIKSTRILLEIINEKNNNSLFHLQENQLPPGSVLMVQQGQKVQMNDIIAQTSEKLKKTAIPTEFFYPFQSKLDGETYFESINLFQLKNKFFSLLNQEDIQQFFNISLNGLDMENDPSLNISTQTPILNEVSNFWLFSAQNQKLKNYKGFTLLNSFLRVGDLISYDTPLYQINFYVPFQTRMKQLNSNLIYENFSINLPINDTKFHKNFYSFFKKTRTTIFGTFFNIDKQQQFSFFWYSKKLFVGNLCFFLLSEKTFFIKSNVINAKNSIYFCGNLLYHSFYFLKIKNDLKLKFYYFYMFKLNNKFLLNKFTLIFLNNLCDFSKKTGNFSIFYKMPQYQFIDKKYVKKYYKNTKQVNLKKNIEFLLSFSFRLKRKLSKIKQNPFILFSLYNTKNILIEKKHLTKVFNYNKSWIIVLNQKKKKIIPFIHYNLSLQNFYLLKNHIFSNLSLEFQTLSINYLHSTQLIYLNTKKTKNKIIFYNKQEIIDSNIKIFQFFLNNLKKLNIIKKIDNNLIFYKLYRFKVSNNKKNYLINSKLSLTQKTKFYIISIKKINQKNIPNNLNVQTPLPFLSNKKKFLRLNKTSPIDTKQNILFNSYKKTPSQEIKYNFIFYPGWFFSKNLIKFNYNLISKKEKNFFYNGFYGNQLFKLKKIQNKSYQLQNFSLIYYNKLQDNLFNKKTKINLYNNHWVIPNINLITKYKYSKYFGDLIRIEESANFKYWSNLSSNDIITLNLPSQCINLKLNLGYILRYNQIIFNNNLMPFNGKVIKINRYQLTFRRGVSFLISKNNAFFISHKNLIFKNQVLFTLKSRRLETQDIVQGIPKIERFFEARENPIDDDNLTVQNKLEIYYANALEILPITDYNFQLSSQLFIHKYLYFAYNDSKNKIQKYLVENIIEAYRNQGVFIAEKHVEIIVREMTNRVRILHSGSTGFLPGEFIQLNTVLNINKKIQIMKKYPAIFDPIVLGITKSVFYSESFLLAASFQEVTRVLVRNSFNKKTDFLLGLHENLIIGQLIPAGSGI